PRKGRALGPGGRSRSRSRPRNSASTGRASTGKSLERVWSKKRRSTRIEFTTPWPARPGSTSARGLACSSNRARRPSATSWWSPCPDGPGKPFWGTELPSRPVPGISEGGECDGCRHDQYHVYAAYRAGDGGCSGDQGDLHDFRPCSSQSPGDRERDEL